MHPTSSIIKLESHFRKSARGPVFYASVSSGAYLVLCGHTPTRIARSARDKVTVIFTNTPELRADAERYFATTRQILQTGSEQTRAATP